MTTKHINPTMILLLFFFLSAVAAHAQTATQASSRYKDFVGENLTAERDLQTVSDYTNAIVSGDLEKARVLLAGNFKSYGPGPRDSADADKEMNNWREGYKTQLNRKVGFVMTTYRVLAGEYQGLWVNQWGSYSFTLNGTPIRVPYQSTYRLTDDGKIVGVSTYYDRQAIMETLGFKLVPPPAPKKGKEK